MLFMSRVCHALASVHCCLDMVVQHSGTIARNTQNLAHFVRLYNFIGESFQDYS